MYVKKKRMQENERKKLDISEDESWKIITIKVKYFEQTI